MRVAIDVQPLHTQSRNHGLGRYVSNLVRSLAEIDSANEYLCVGIRNPTLPEPELPSRMKEIEIDLGISSPKVEFFGTEYDPSYLAQLEQIVREERIDLFHATSPLMFDTIFPESLSCPIVATVPDIIPYVLDYVHQWPAEITASYFRRLNLVKRHATRILAISNWTKNDLVKYLDIPEIRIAVTHLGVDPRLQSNAHLQMKEKNGGYILYTGNYEYRKNIESLILAYSKLPPEVRKSYSLVIDCDDSGGRDNMMKLAAEANLKERVEFVSPRTDSDLASLYRNAALFVFPSLYEGFGFPPLEAMAFGVPVAASNASSIPEIVGNAALLFDPRNVDDIAGKIQAALSDEKLRSRLIESGYERVSQFSWRRCASETIAAYRGCVTKKASSFISAKPKIAYFSPLNPCASGISDYSEELLEFLQEYFEIDLYVDGYEPSNAWLKKKFRIRDMSGFEGHVLEYVAAVYNMSNNANFHMSIYKQMQRHPGITILHEYNCHPSFFHAYLYQSRNERAYIEEMAINHGATGVEEARRVIREGSPNFWAFPLNKRALLFSKAAIVHVPALAAQLREQNKVPILAVPHGMRAPKSLRLEDLTARKLELRAKYGIPEETIVLETAGFLSRLRRLDVCFRVFARLKPEFPKIRYLAAGTYLDTGLREELIALSRNLSIDSDVEFVTPKNRMTLAEYQERLQLCDIFVNLRYPSPGAASGTLARALSFAKPVVASRIPDFAHYPDDCVWKVDTDGTEETLLFYYLRRLCKDTDLRAKMGENALSYAKAHDWRIVSKSISDFVLSNVD